MPISFSKLAIRFALHGCKNRPFYHLVVMHKYKGRDKPPIEQLGSYDPMPNIHDEKLVAINFDRLQYYIIQGAEITRPVEKLLGIYPKGPFTQWGSENTSLPTNERVFKLATHGHPTV